MKCIYEYLKEKDSKKSKTGHVNDKTETGREIRERNKRKENELSTRLEGQIREWSQGEPESDEITESARKVLNRVGKATTELIWKIIRDGMETEKISTTEEVYKYNEYIILDVSWSQFVEGNTGQTKTRSKQRISESNQKL